MSRLVRLSAVCLALSPAGAARAADKIAVELHEWSMWIVDPTLTQANAKDHYPNNLPVFIDSLRSRLSGRAENRPSPLGMITLYGEAATGLEVEMQLASSSRFMAHWPPAESKSKRVRWLELSLTKAPTDSGRIAPAEQDHWFNAARAQDDALYISQGARTERFLCYDVETAWMPAVKVSGGPDKYQVTNLGKDPLEDVFVSVAGDNGRRIGRLKHVPANPKSAKDAKAAPADKKNGGEKKQTPIDAAANAIKEAVDVVKANVAAPAAATSAAATAPKPPAGAKKPAPVELDPACTAEVVMSAALPPDGPEFQEQGRAALRTVLLEAGLKAPEADLFLSLYADAIFKSSELVVLFRLNPDAIEEQFPLVTYPDIKRIVRVPLVLVRNVDPQLQRGMEALVAQLGNADFKTREAAEKRLLELGRLAIPLLKEALKNADPEVVFRAERILLSQKESINGSSATLTAPLAPAAPAVNGVFVPAKP
jgi:hypothetical protein